MPGTLNATPVNPGTLSNTGITPTGGTFPGATTFPGSTTFPGKGNTLAGAVATAHTLTETPL